jgi:tetratricopeptide (TPR) repeat protein
MKSKAVLALIVVVACAAALHAFVLMPWKCSHVKREVEALIEQLLELERPPLPVVARFRTLCQGIHHCIRQMPYDLDFRLEAAACAVLVGRTEEAIEQYRAALRIDRRPEIYLNLGNALYKAGRRQEAVAAFARLLSFATFIVNYDSSVPWSGERVLDLVPVDLQKDVEKEADRLRTLARHRR